MITPVLPLAPDATTPVNGGAVCLAFANTVWWRRGAEPNDQLTGYTEVIDQVAGRLDPAVVADIRDAADADPRVAGRALRRALELREAVYAVFAAIAQGSAPPDADLSTIDAWVGRAAGRLHLVAIDGGFVLRAKPDTASDLLDLPLCDVALSAAALLTSDELDRVRACPGPTCGGLFVDTTRNRSRRWCDPAQCGNRERVRAHYHRTHTAG